jgi:hypothetical protein
MTAPDRGATYQIALASTGSSTHVVWQICPISDPANRHRPSLNQRYSGSPSRRSSAGRSACRTRPLVHSRLSWRRSPYPIDSGPSAGEAELALVPQSGRSAMVSGIGGRMEGVTGGLSAEALHHSAGLLAVVTASISLPPARRPSSPSPFPLQRNCGSAPRHRRVRSQLPP